ncbi:hypothetical protein QO015_000465 [Kaistia geumhonensis]|uniref:Uncharacterized protein n=1 Tax=Kaistia geumhonensis TaxID=410839 RepID=A0ABU0M1M4_9HYPH|nr:hypothetical protein [Kaistia geumhonensis]
MSWGWPADTHVRRSAAPLPIETSMTKRMFRIVAAGGNAVAAPRPA